MLLYLLCRVGHEIVHDRVNFDTKNSLFKVQVRPFRIAPVTKIQPVLFVDIKSVQISMVVMVRLFTKRAVLQSKNIRAGAVELYLVLIKELLNRDLWAVKFGLVDKIFKGA